MAQGTSFDVEIEQYFQGNDDVVVETPIGVRRRRPRQNRGLRYPGERDSLGIWARHGGGAAWFGKGER
jgi:hypothetical protein